jgi:hypothetical protein
VSARDDTALVPLTKYSAPENRIQVSTKACAVSYTLLRGQNLKVFEYLSIANPEHPNQMIPFTYGPLELHVLRDILMHKFGREFSVAVMENRDGCVTDRVSDNQHVLFPNPYTYLPFLPPYSLSLTTLHVLKVVRKLGVETPSTQLVDAYLTEIAKAYSVQWTPPIENVDGDNGSNDHDPDGGVKVSWK